MQFLFCHLGLNHPLPPLPAVTPPTGRPSLNGSTSLLGQPPGSSTLRDQEEEEDVVKFLDEQEAMKFSQFDPEVSDNNTWYAGEDVNTFLQKNFNQTIKSLSCDKIMNNFPKPTCQVLQV